MIFLKSIYVRAHQLLKVLFGDAHRDHKTGQLLALKKAIKVESLILILEHTLRNKSRRQNIETVFLVEIWIRYLFTKMIYTFIKRNQIQPLSRFYIGLIIHRFIQTSTSQWNTSIIFFYRRYNGRYVYLISSEIRFSMIK